MREARETIRRKKKSHEVIHSHNTKDNRNKNIAACVSSNSISLLISRTKKFAQQTSQQIPENQQGHHRWDSEHQCARSQDHSHFLGFRTRPSGSPPTFRISHTFFSNSTLPTIPPSSMYHFWYTGWRAAIWSMRDWRPQQKYSGPRGSPCWTPDSFSWL